METSYICEGVDWWSWIWESQWLLGSGVMSSLHCFESYSCMTCTVWTNLKKTFEFTSHCVCSMRFLVIMSLQFDFLLGVAWQPVLYIYIYTVRDFTRHEHHPQSVYMAGCLHFVFWFRFTSVWNFEFTPGKSFLTFGSHWVYTWVVDFSVRVCHKIL